MVKPSISGGSPLSPTRWPADAFNARGVVTFVAFLALAVVAGIAFAIALIAVATLGLHHPPGTPGHPSATYLWTAIVGQMVLYIPVMFVVVRYLPRVARRSLRELGLRPPRPREIGIGLLGAIAMYLLVALGAYAQYALSHVKAHQQSVELLTRGHDPAFLAAFALLAVVFAPVAEESIFRGFVFNALLRHTPVWIAALASSVLFAAGHLEPTALLPLAFGGIALAFVYYSTGSLAASMITHGTFNLINVIAIIATGGKAGT